MNNIAVCENRLKNIIISDKRENPVKIERVLKSELLNVLKNYFELTSEDIDLSIMIRDDGKYGILLNAISRHIRIANSFDI